MASNDTAAAKGVPWALLAAAALYFCIHAVVLLLLPLIASSIRAEPRQLAVAAIVLYSASAALLDIPTARLLRRLRLRTIAGGSALLAAAAAASTAWIVTAPGLLAAATVLGAATAGMMGPILSSLASAARENQQRVQSLNAAAQRTGALLMGVGAAFVLTDPQSIGVAAVISIAACGGLLAAVVVARVPLPGMTRVPAKTTPLRRKDIGRGMLLNAVIPVLMIFGASFLPLAVITDGAASFGPGEVAAGLMGREAVAILLSLTLIRCRRISPSTLVTSTAALGAICLAATTLTHHPVAFVLLFSVHGATIAAAIIASNLHLAAGSTQATRPTAFALGGIASRASALAAPIIFSAVSFDAPLLILTTSALVLMSGIVYLLIGRLRRSRP